MELQRIKNRNDMTLFKKLRTNIFIYNSPYTIGFLQKSFSLHKIILISDRVTKNLFIYP